MDPSANLPILPEPPGPAGELVVQNGRLDGVRRSLELPLTLIGQSGSCDLRLGEAGVALFHCAILRDRAGLILRHLDASTTTRVNGRAVHTHHLVNGDVIEVGPVHLAVALDAPTTCEVPSADLILAEREREALRIQAAAVAAQQAVLSEEEARLGQRGTALERQEAQLAAHLEDRQRQLDEQQAQLKEARAAHQAESAAGREALAQLREEVVRQQKETQEQQQACARQRQRLSQLRRRMWRRYQRLGQDREADLKRREAELAAGLKGLQGEKAAVRALQERLNTEAELGRRQLLEEGQALALAQQWWEGTLNQEKAENQRRLAEVEKREAAVSAAERALAQQQQRWQQHEARLAREAEGVEERIRNQRAILEQLQREGGGHQAAVAAVQVITVPPLAPALQPAGGRWPEPVSKLAELLDDQRAHLAEQWRQLLEVEQRWQQERAAGLSELQAAVEHLAARERELTGAEQRLRDGEADCVYRKEQLAAMRGALEGRRALLSCEEASWQAQREEASAQIAQRERALQRRERLLEDVHQRRNRLRKQEVAEVQAARDRCDDARREYSRLWQECEQLRQALTEQERALAGKALALERYRQETIQSAPDSARAESRLDRLGKREISRLDVETREVQAERRKLATERSRLDGEQDRLRGLEQELSAREQEWAHQVAEWERHRAAVEEEWQQREQELRRLRTQHAVAERQLRQLREELERLARVLIEEAEAPASQQAA